MNNFINKNKIIIIGVTVLTLVIVGTSGYSLHAKATFNNLKVVADKVGINVVDKSNKAIQSEIDTKYAELDTNYNTLINKANELGIDISSLSGEVFDKISQLNDLIIAKENEIAAQLEQERISKAQENARVEQQKQVATTNSQSRSNPNNNVVVNNNTTTNSIPQLNLPEVKVVNVGFTIQKGTNNSYWQAAMIASGLTANELTFWGENHNPDGSINGWSFRGSDGLAYEVYPNGDVEITKPLFEF